MVDLISKECMQLRYNSKMNTEKRKKTQQRPAQEEEKKQGRVYGLQYEEEEEFEPTDALLEQLGKKFIDGSSKNKDEVAFDYNKEFLVDPFFRKTTQMFDEGSSKGLLLNHLSIKDNHMITLNAAQLQP